MSGEPKETGATCSKSQSEVVSVVFGEGVYGAAKDVLWLWLSTYCTRRKFGEEADEATRELAQHVASALYDTLCLEAVKMDGGFPTDGLAVADPSVYGCRFDFLNVLVDYGFSKCKSSAITDYEACRSLYNLITKTDSKCPSWWPTCKKGIDYIQNDQGTMYCTRRVFVAVIRRVMQTASRQGARLGSLFAKLAFHYADAQKRRAEVAEQRAGTAQNLLGNVMAMYETYDAHVGIALEGITAKLGRTMITDELEGLESLRKNGTAEINALCHGVEFATSGGDGKRITSGDDEATEEHDDTASVCSDFTVYDAEEGELYSPGMSKRKASVPKGISTINLTRGPKHPRPSQMDD